MLAIAGHSLQFFAMEDVAAKSAGLQRWVEGPSGKVLDARVDVLRQSVILHSRGGSTAGRPPRNTQYEEALREICRRGKASDAFTRILIDSTPARALSEDRRTLLGEEEIRSLDVDELVRAIRSRLRTFGQTPGAAGGNSTKRVRFDLRFGTAAQILRLRTTPPSTRGFRRIPAEELQRVTAEHVHVAVARLLAGVSTDRFADSRDYDLITPDVTRLPPKQVFGFALGLALGVEVGPEDFSGGTGTPCFQILEAAGYPIVPKGYDDPREVETILLGLDDEEARIFAEGSKSRAWHLKRERNPELTTLFKKNFLAKHGRFYCEHCSKDWVDEYGPEIAPSCFDAHHAAVQVSDMEDGHGSTINDLELLCSNCHRAEHRRMRVAAG